MDSKTEIQIDSIVERENSKEIEEKDDFIKGIFGPSLNLETHLTLKDKIKHILHSNLCHIVIIILVLIDTGCVAGELTIAAENEAIREKLKPVEEVFKYLGLSILSFFMVELIFKIAFARHELLESKLEIFDALVVVVSFSLDLVFLNNDNGADIAIGFLTLLRLWRLTRIVNGFVISIKRRAQSKLVKCKEEIRELEIENELLKKKLEIALNELNELKK